MHFSHLMSFFGQLIILLFLCTCFRYCWTYANITDITQQTKEQAKGTLHSTSVELWWPTMVSSFSFICDTGRVTIATNNKIMNWSFHCPSFFVLLLLDIPLLSSIISYVYAPSCTIDSRLYFIISSSLIYHLWSVLFVITCSRLVLCLYCENIHKSSCTAYGNVLSKRIHSNKRISLLFDINLQLVCFLHYVIYGPLIYLCS
jgi:hypothetical protein